MVGPTGIVRRLPIGAEVVDGGVHFRVWAPRARQVEVVFETARDPRGPVLLAADEGGYHAGLAQGARAGDLYRLRLDGADALPDPASRRQPRGPHGPSEVVDPSTFTWTDGAYRGVPKKGRVLYELHVGTFTEEGTWAAAARELPFLADLGITVIEMMPIAEFSGTFGWGYDGVDLFAPTRLYGAPDDLRAFVDRAHALGIGVILDVVYNHLGPDGNYLARFSDGYFTTAQKTDWGEAIRFHGEGSAPVRELFLSNAAYWIEEFHFDGLRLDATQDIHDRWDDHILARVAERVRAAAGGRSTWMVGENEPQDRRLLAPSEEGGAGLDALWNDDFHHAALVAATGRSEAYFKDYQGTPQELISAVKWGFLYQGQWYSWQDQPRGTFALDLPASAFIAFLQNHDQIANTSGGARLHQLAAPGLVRALTALALLAPSTPMIFQGQEFASSSPFLYFADYEEPLASLVAAGRAAFLRQFPSAASDDAQRALDHPSARATFERSRLDLRERETHATTVALHRDLLALRRSDPVFAAERSDAMHGAVLGPQAFLLRFLDPEHGDRLLLVNLGSDLAIHPVPEPLLAPPRRGEWEIALSTEDLRYGGSGTPPVHFLGAWRLPGHSALVLAAGPPRHTREGCV